MYMNKLYAFIIMLSFSFCTLSTDSANEKNKSMMMMSLAYGMGSAGYVFISNTGKLDIVKHTNMSDSTYSGSIPFSVNPGEVACTANYHCYIGFSSTGDIAVIDASITSTSTPSLIQTVTAQGKNPVHMYTHSDTNTVWVLNDGGTTTTTGCTFDSSVTIIKDASGNVNPATALKNICLDQGHHKMAFSTSPNRAFISSITGNTIKVIDNDPTSATYLTLLSTITLAAVNGVVAGPHGLAYSSVTKKIYNSNQTQGTVIEIDPTSYSQTIINTTKSGTAYVSEDGKYFVTKGSVTGTATTGTAGAITGKIITVRLSDKTVSSLDLPDVSPDNFFISPAGNRVFVATSLGYGKIPLYKDKLEVIDTTDPTSLKVLKEVTIGATQKNHRGTVGITHGSALMNIYIPSDVDGNLYVLDANGNISKTISLGGAPSGINSVSIGHLGTHAH